jgi:hypothetical protein
MTSASSMSETMRICPEHFGHRSGSASHTFLINSRHFLEGMRRGSWAETSITSTPPNASWSATSPRVCSPRGTARTCRLAPMNCRSCARRGTAKSRLRAVSTRERRRHELLQTLAKTHPWPRNVLRHSFGSYHLAFIRNEALTAAEMGNSPAGIFQHYRALVTSEAAETFWN